MTSFFGWPQVARLGLVQAALGAIVVLTTSTLNRVMVVELALPALLPGLLVALHHAVQITRPRMGHGSDVGGRRTPWIIGGMAVLAGGGVLAALATAWMGSEPGPGAALAALGFVLIGLGVSACGTALLTLLAKRVAPDRRAGAATVVWLMMIVGFAVTAGVTGKLLDPYSPARLVQVTSGVALIAVLVTVLALWGLEGHAATRAEPDEARPDAQAFRTALREVWADEDARRFSVFVFLSMLAYAAQDLVLEPFAGQVLGYTPGQTTSLSGLQHGGVLVGMLAAAAAGREWRGLRLGTLRGWTVGGCIASALAMAGLVMAALVGPEWPFRLNVWLLGAANGAFSIAAIGSMMHLAGAQGGGREGVRMGLFGAAQGIAFGLGGLVGTGASDLARWAFGLPDTAYASVFALEAAMFVAAAGIAAGRRRARPASGPGALTGPTTLQVPR
ncbi:BCD family MFS transporter [Ideonella alba]|uniref:BCD family MFS transporter n=1 Tax=Ideonella alba TaxID=2824118 RepID=A0A941BDN2_9BURK|nr:BCD family MFS transporter [Ideonella alba]MBQ0930361.1 BCD family MFS transporter [Ideonella alba]